MDERRSAEKRLVKNAPFGNSLAASRMISRSRFEAKLNQRVEASCDKALENRPDRGPRFYSFEVFSQARQRWIWQHAEAFQARKARQEIGIDQREVAQQELLLADLIFKALQEFF